MGISLADGAGAAISSPWDFPPKVLVIFAKGSSDFLQVPWERQIPRAEACSGENVGGINNLLQEQLSRGGAELLSRGVSRRR